MKRFLEAGKIVNTHGIRGEVKIVPWCDSAEFLLGVPQFYIDEAQFKVRSSRVHKGSLLASLEGVDTVDAAMALKNRVVFIDRNDVSLPENVYFIQDLIGFDVFDRRKNAVIGKLTDVLNLPASDVYVVKGEREVMIPAVPEFIKETDVERQTVFVCTIPGMGDEDEN